MLPNWERSTRVVLYTGTLLQRLKFAWSGRFMKNKNDGEVGVFVTASSHKRPDVSYIHTHKRTRTNTYTHTCRWQLPKCGCFTCFRSGTAADIGALGHASAPAGAEDGALQLGVGRMEYPTRKKFTSPDSRPHTVTLSSTSSPGGDDVEDRVTVCEKESPSGPEKESPSKAPSALIVEDVPFYAPVIAPVKSIPSCRTESSAYVVESSVVTVSGLQPVQVFEGTIFQKPLPRAERAAAHQRRSSTPASVPSKPRRARSAGRSKSSERSGHATSSAQHLHAREGTPNTVALIELMQLTTLQLCRCAQLLLAEGNWQGALAAYRRAIVVDPNNLLALIECGKLLTAHEDEENGLLLQNRAFSLMAWALADVCPNQVLSGADAVDMLNRALRKQQRQVDRTSIPPGQSVDAGVLHVWLLWQHAVAGGGMGGDKASQLDIGESIWEAGQGWGGQNGRGGGGGDIFSEVMNAEDGEHASGVRRRRDYYQVPSRGEVGEEARKESGRGRDGEKLSAPPAGGGGGGGGGGQAVLRGGASSMPRVLNCTAARRHSSSRMQSTDTGAKMGTDTNVPLAPGDKGPRVLNCTHLSPDKVTTAGGGWAPRRAEPGGGGGGGGGGEEVEVDDPREHEAVEFLSGVTARRVRKVCMRGKGEGEREGKKKSEREERKS